MTKNPILEELRETRERLLADAGGTLDGLVVRLQRDERESHRAFVRPRRGTDRCSGPATPGTLAIESPSSPPRGP